MALIIVISTEDFQIRWNVLSLSFSERDSGNRPLGLSHHLSSILSVMIVMIVFNTLEKYPFETTN